MEVWEKESGEPEEVIGGGSGRGVGRARLRNGERGLALLREKSGESVFVDLVHFSWVRRGPRGGRDAERSERDWNCGSFGPGSSKGDQGFGSLELEVAE